MRKVASIIILACLYTVAAAIAYHLGTYLGGPILGRVLSSTTLLFLALTVRVDYPQEGPFTADLTFLGKKTTKR